MPQCLVPGDIVDRQGHVLGHHEGVPLYTIGQRKGLGIAAAEPLYVVALDMKKNQVVVGRSGEVYAGGLVAGDLNWIAFDAVEKPMRLSAKIRYGKNEAMADVVMRRDGRLQVKFDEPQRAVTPGQSVVFYDEDIVAGGGIIEEVCQHV